MSLINKSKNQNDPKVHEPDFYFENEPDFEKTILSALKDLNKKSILDQIKEVNRLLIFTDLWFQSEMNEDMIESCIHQREALSEKYRNLISEAKQHNITSEPFKNLY